MTAGLVAAGIATAAAHAHAQQVDVRVQVEVPRQVVRDVHRLVSSVVSAEVLQNIARGLRQDVTVDLERSIDLAASHLDTIGERIGRTVEQAFERGSGRTASAWQDRTFRAEQIDRQTRTLSLGPSGSLSLRSLSGEITVKAGTARDTTVEIIRRARGRTPADARTGLERVTVNVDQRGNAATVEARYPEDRRPPYSVSTEYIVTTPPGTDVAVNTMSGNVSIAGVQGDVTVDVISGNVTVTGAGRVSSVKTVSGNVRIDGADTNGNLDVVTISGEVTLDRVTARRLDVNVTSGAITVREIRTQQADIKSLVGAIEFAGTLAPNGRYELQSHNGPIRLVVAPDASFTLQAKTFSGRIQPDSSIEMKNVRSTRTSFSGVVGSGAANVTATTFSGSVTIVRR